MARQIQIGNLPDAEHILIRCLASSLFMTSCDRRLFAPAAYQLIGRGSRDSPEVSCITLVFGI